MAKSYPTFQYCSSMLEHVLYPAVGEQSHRPPPGKRTYISFPRVHIAKLAIRKLDRLGICFSLFMNLFH